MPTASIYCDGACRGNGRAGAMGGWAWAYWPGAAGGEPTAGAAERLGAPSVATNQRAELRALLEALQWWGAHGGGGPVRIYSDSQYAINCASVWGPGWKRRGWIRGAGEPIQNLDLIQPLVDLWGLMRVPLVHVRGHQTGDGPESWGNNWVDRMAVAAAEGQGARFDRRRGTAIALMDGGDTVEHVGVAIVLAPAPAPVKKKVAAAPTVQSDIRSWFGSC